MLETLQLKLAGWSFKTFLGKYIRRGVRVGISFVLGRIATGALSAYGVTIDPVVMESTLDALIWSKLELLANIAKTKADQSDKWRWIGNFL